jgi:hypothetical protein
MLLQMLMSYEHQAILSYFNYQPALPYDNQL